MFAQNLQDVPGELTQPGTHRSLNEAQLKPTALVPVAITSQKTAFSVVPNSASASRDGFPFYKQLSPQTVVRAPKR